MIENKILKCIIKKLEKKSVYKKIVKNTNEITSRNNIFENDKHLIKNKKKKKYDI
ncbi:hypothetical protein [Vibrio parahaemolyticus]|uniref:hypothetical protein n=1 Tax=Vibrio parahaemolyticus TaxID=670 RepID=UPI00128F16A7|nr:hypothetical protein [Vibrio parahaemolyticus]